MTSLFMKEVLVQMTKAKYKLISDNISDKDKLLKVLHNVFLVKVKVNC